MVLDAFKDLDLQVKPIVREPPNIGHLASMKMWIDIYASEHDGQIPTFDQLKSRCLHAALKQASSEYYHILATGKLSDLEPHQPVICFRRPNALHEYFVLQDGQLIAKPV